MTKKSSLTLGQQGRRATRMLRGKAVAKIRRRRSREVMLEFQDGTRLYVDSASAVELSITEGPLK